MGKYSKKQFSKFVICKNQFMSKNMLELLNNPDQFLNNDTTHMIQNNFKSKVGIVQLDSRKIVIKRHNYKSNMHRFRRYFRPTRASRNWRFSKILLDNNIWVPTPVAFVETRIGPLRGMSYFMYEYVEGLTGKEYFKSKEKSHAKIEYAMNLVVELMKKIKNLNLIHGDIRMLNLIFKNEKICLLDLDDIKPMTWYQANRVKNRDMRGLKKDIYYNIPAALQKSFLERLESV